MDAKKEERSYESGSQAVDTLALLQSLHALVSQMRGMAAELRRTSVVMHRQNRILMSLVEQNASMVEMFVQDAEEEDDVAIRPRPVHE